MLPEPVVTLRPAVMEGVRRRESLRGSLLTRLPLPLEMALNHAVRRWRIRRLYQSKRAGKLKIQIRDVKLLQQELEGSSQTLTAGDASLAASLSVQLTALKGEWLALFEMPQLGIVSPRETINKASTVKKEKKFLVRKQALVQQPVLQPKQERVESPERRKDHSHHAKEEDKDKDKDNRPKRQVAAVEVPGKFASSREIPRTPKPQAGHAAAFAQSDSASPPLQHPDSVVVGMGGNSPIQLSEKADRSRSASPVKRTYLKRKPVAYGLGQEAMKPLDLSHVKSAVDCHMEAHGPAPGKMVQDKKQKQKQKPVHKPLDLSKITSKVGNRIRAQSATRMRPSTGDSYSSSGHDPGQKESRHHHTSRARSQTERDISTRRKNTSGGIVTAETAAASRTLSQPAAVEAGLGDNLPSVTLTRILYSILEEADYDINSAALGVTNLRFFSTPEEGSLVPRLDAQNLRI